MSRRRPARSQKMEEPIGLRPHERPWSRGLFRSRPAIPITRGLLVSLLVHGVLAVSVLAGAFERLAFDEEERPEPELITVEVELPKIPPRRPELVQARPARNPSPAPALGEVPGPVPKGQRRRKGRDSIEDAARAGVLGMLGNLGGKGDRRASRRGGTAGPDQRSEQPFAGLVGGLKDYEGGYLPVGGAGGSGIGVDEGGGRGGGRGTGHAKDLLNSYGDGTGDQIILERRGSASGIEGGIGAGDGDGGCRDEVLIAQVVESHRGGIRRCYNSALERDKSLRGEISVRFVIAESGAVRTVKVTGTTLADDALVSCVLQRVRSWTFGETEACETIVHYTFNLTRSF